MTISDERLAELVAWFVWIDGHDDQSESPCDPPPTPELLELAQELVELREIVRVRDAVLDLHPAPDLTGPVPYPMDFSAPLPSTVDYLREDWHGHVPERGPRFGEPLMPKDNAGDIVVYVVAVAVLIACALTLFL